jgi:hypothetical protein
MLLAGIHEGFSKTGLLPTACGNDELVGRTDNLFVPGALSPLVGDFTINISKVWPTLSRFSNQVQQMISVP